MSGQRGEAGQSLVEYALVLPLLLLLFLGIIEVSIVLSSYSTISNAAREGARYGVVHPGDSAGVEAAARALTTGLNPARLTINSTVSSTSVRVEIIYPVPLVTGIVIEALGGNPILTLRTVSTMQLE